MNQLNLLKDPWLPIIRKDGDKEKIAIHQLLNSYAENPIMELESPRPDFRNALYQLLIGIVQVAAMPENERKWKRLFSEPYSSKEFSERVLKYEKCFEIDSDGPAFMQDFDNLSDQSEKPIYWLIMGSPGENTIKLNKAHFVKDIQGFQLDPYWAAIALFELQTVGPPDGGGHREGLSGSGALTTIILPVEKVESSTLWQKIWINIFPKEYINSWNGNREKQIFPWMIQTKSSTGDVKTFFDDLHPLSVYWGFPRRTRLLFSEKLGICSLTNTKSENLVKGYKMLKHGTLYHNTWQHPFVPYQNEHPDKEGKKKNSMRAITANFSYANWCSVALNNERYKNSRIIDYFFTQRHSTLRRELGITSLIWTSGFHMKSGEATVINWNEAKWPLYDLTNEESAKVYNFINMIVSEATIIQTELIESIKKAWFKPRIIGRGKESWKRVVDSRKFTLSTSHITSSFWQKTEPSFYSLLKKLVENLEDVELKNSLLDEWGTILKREVENLFDANALAQQEDGLNMKRVVKSRQELGKGIGKMFKNLKALKDVEE